VWPTTSSTNAETRKTEKGITQNEFKHLAMRKNSVHFNNRHSIFLSVLKSVETIEET